MVLSRLSDSVPAAVLSGFGLSPEDGWTVRHLRTLNNTVFGIGRGDDQPVWALRRHRSSWRSSDAISAELDLLDYLADQLPDRVRVPRPGRGPGGDRLITVAGAHYSLLEWIPGTPRRRGSGLDAAGARLLGFALGSIHSATDRWDRASAPMEWNANTLFLDHPGLLGADPASLKTFLSGSDLELFGKINIRTSEVFDQARDWGLIHADFILGNCHWTDGADPITVGVLDFDDFGRGPRLFDLGAILGNLADYPETWDTYAAEFLAGYRTAHELSDSAERDLPLMMAARHTSHCLWALGHQDLGQDWIRTHLHERMVMARECLAVRF